MAKTNHIPLILILASFYFGSCSNELTKVNDVDGLIFTIDSYKVEDANDLITKTGLSGTSFIWTVKDTVGIFPESGNQVYFSMASGANASTAQFDGGGWELKNGKNYWSYFPLIGEFYLDKTSIPVTYTGQVQNGNNNSEHIGIYDFLYTDASMPQNGSLMFNYHHLDCILKPRVTLPAGTYTKIDITATEDIFVIGGKYDLTADSPVVNEDVELTDKISLDLENVVFTESTELIAFLMAYPVNVANKELTVTVYDSSNKGYSYTYTRTSSFAAGSIHNLRGEYVPDDSGNISDGSVGEEDGD